jgi:hypothetical protein
MNTFDDIQELWGKQNGPEQSAQSPNDIIAKAEKSSKELRLHHFSTMGILSLTGLCVAWYAWAYGNTEVSDATLGLLLMIGSMLIRVGAEYFSFLKFKKISLQNTTKACLEATISFQTLRQRIQYILTPLALASYVLGFILLLPYVKASVSIGFYWYILISGVVFLIFISVIIYRQIKRENQLMTHLGERYASLIE